VTELAIEPESSPSSFDAVIVGAGHNGLTLAAYLARSGLSVGVFERRGEEGGGLCTEELTLPGFLHNVHANYHTFVGLAPAFRHLGILEQGVEYARPEVQMASVFDDGRALCVHTDIERTCASIARFSERDAETFGRFKTEARQYVDLMLETFMYGPPVGINDLTKALVTFGLEGRSEFLEAKLRGSTIEQFLDRHFESDQVKAARPADQGVVHAVGDRLQDRGDDPLRGLARGDHRHPRRRRLAGDRGRGARARAARRR
jgi:phytoene dehydrogenase-like protein